MAGKTNASAGSGSRVLTLVWLVVSAGLAYPAYTMLASWGLNPALAGLLVFLGICLFYDVPYRARVKEEYEANISRAEQWRGRKC